MDSPRPQTRSQTGTIPKPNRLPTISASPNTSTDLAELPSTENHPFKAECPCNTCTCIMESAISQIKNARRPEPNINFNPAPTTLTYSTTYSFSPITTASIQFPLPHNQNQIPTEVSSQNHRPRPTRSLSPVTQNLNKPNLTNTHNPSLRPDFPPLKPPKNTSSLLTSNIPQTYNIPTQNRYSSLTITPPKTPHEPAYTTQTHNNKPTTPSAAPRNQNNPPRTRTFNLRNLPNTVSQQKELYITLKSPEVLGRPPLLLKVNYNRTALCRAETDLPTAQFERKLRQKCGDPKITVVEFTREPFPNTPTPQKPTYSLIIRGVDKALPVEEIKDLLEEQNFPFHRVFRVISRATNEPTQLVRVLTEDKDHYAKALNYGLSFYGLHHNVEASHPTTLPSIPKYCSRCTQIGHLAAECPSKVFLCPHCGGEHKSHLCPNIQNPSCNNCSGSHPSYSSKCAQRTTPVETPQKVTPITLPKQPTYYNLTDEIKSSIQLNSTLLMTVLPSLRPLIQKTLNECCQALFGESCHITGAGNVAFYTFTKIHS